MSDPHCEQNSPDVEHVARISPVPDETETGLKLPKKREREVSLEPATPSATGDHEGVRERKDSRTPLKSRRKLDTTQEEEDGGPGSRSGSGSRSDSPPPDASPRMRLKVRQISRGVEGISWKNFKPDDSAKDRDVLIEEGATYEQSADFIDLAPAALIETQKDDDADLDDTPPRSPDETQTQDLASVQDLSSLASLASMQSVATTSTAVTRPRSGSDGHEKGIKRKFLERGSSQGPGGPPSSDTETLKRPRDEADKDDNPRETKRPSPPPDKTTPSPKIPKSGFMAYASTSSPFASVKGSNIFKAATSSAGSIPLAGVDPAPSSSRTSVPKRSGFESFQSSSSPFAAFSRSKSPVLGGTPKLGRAKSPPPRKAVSSMNASPFASYAGTASPFSTPVASRVAFGLPNSQSQGALDPASGSALASLGSGQTVGDGSDSGDEEKEAPSTFGERLRASKDEEEDEEEDSAVRLTKRETETGEEDEETIHQARGKLFSLHENSWRERGTGIFKINVRRDDGTGARLVMRKDAVLTLLLNVGLFPGFQCSLMQDPRYLRFSAIENGAVTTYNLKVANAKIASELLEEIQAIVRQ